MYSLKLPRKNNRYTLQKSEMEIKGFNLFTTNFNEKDSRGVAIHIVEKVHLGCRLNVAQRNMGPSADHCLTIYMPTRRHTDAPLLHKMAICMSSLTHSSTIINYLWGVCEP